MFEPVIKWSGSKRSQAECIIGYFPKKMETYYEPFCGGASVLRRLLSSNIKVGRYVCSDLNGSLIELWNAIKDRPYDVIEHYRELWRGIHEKKSIDEKKDYFIGIRSRYNETKDPLDFMFIMRTTTNGVPRFNKDGNFNNTYHATRDGIQPDKLATIVYDWNSLLNENDVEFINCTYSDIKPNANDFVYLDPPYANTKGMYFGSIDFEELWDWMGDLKCPYALSFNGINGDDDNTYEVPRYLYDRHEYVLSGNSSYTRIFGSRNDTIVKESLYLKGCSRKGLF